MRSRSARRSPSGRAALVALVLVTLASSRAAGQRASGLESACAASPVASFRLATVRRIYVADLGTAQGADALRDALRESITGSATFQLVHDSLQADAVLRGSGEATRSEAVAAATTADGSSVTDVTTPRYRGVLHLELHAAPNDAEVWRYDASEDLQLRPQGEPIARRAVGVLHARARLAARCARLQRARSGPSA